MKYKKKTMMIASFTIGALLLTTAALADIISKSGYDRLKDSIKLTAESTIEKADSYTFESSMEVKENGRLLISDYSTEKYDRLTGATERINSGRDPYRGDYSYYYFSDRKTTISYSSMDPVCYVTEYENEMRYSDQVYNPFKEDSAEDIEKIIDALVGNLRDYVMMEENDDGSYHLEGSLSKAQIPALVNAVTSYAIKQNIRRGWEQEGFPKLTKDVYVREVKGTAKVAPDGILENIFGSAVLTGMDEQGISHDLSFEMLITITDINATVVKKPDLTGKETVTTKLENPYDNSPERYLTSNPELFVGTFKNDIITIQEGKFVKVGEQFLVIEELDNQFAAGRYYAEFKPEFAEYADSKPAFAFTAGKRDQQWASDFVVTTDSGVQGYLYFEVNGRIYFVVDSKPGTVISDKMIYDHDYRPVLD